MTICLDAVLLGCRRESEQSPKSWCGFCVVGPLFIFNVYIPNLGLELLVVVEQCPVGAEGLAQLC